MHIREVSIEEHGEEVIPQYLEVNRDEVEVHEVYQRPHFPVSQHCRPELMFDFDVSLLK